jgi:hypothetical protein
MEIPPYTKGLAAELNAGDLHKLAADIYSQWLNAGAEAKHRGALLLFGVNADSDDIATLQKQIASWIAVSRGAIAAEAVRAMALSGLDIALMVVDGMARKFKHRGVRNAAEETMTMITAALEITPDQLADKIIPTLGFNTHGEKLIDYGARSFTAFLSTKLTVELKDGAGKVIKSLPKTNANDDEQKAAAAKTEFNAIKKNMKAIVAMQTARLEAAMVSSRKWSEEAWTALFVHNPIMHAFAVGLIWGVYKDGGLTTTFRYAGDGSLSSEKDETISLADYKDCEIGLVHPIELTKGSIAAWKAQLIDYELEQPLLQLDRQVYSVTNDYAKLLPEKVSLYKLYNMGWERGEEKGQGSYNDCSKYFANVEVCLQHSWLQFNYDSASEATVEELHFYTELAKVPARAFSEVIYEMNRAANK